MDHDFTRWTKGGQYGCQSSGEGSLPKRGELNTVKKLHHREIGDRSRSSRSCANGIPEKFQHFLLKEEFDVYNEDIQVKFRRSPLTQRSTINVITAAKDIVLSLSDSGLCVAWSLTTNKRICFINLRADETIYTLTYNKYNDSIIIHYTYVTENHKFHRFRTLPIKCIRKNQINAGHSILENEIIRPPKSSLRYDVLNGKILTYSKENGTCKIFEMADYRYLYSISSKDISEIETSLGTLLLIKETTSGYIPITIISIEDGTVLKSFKYPLSGPPTRYVECIYYISGKVLIKQDHKHMEIIDVCNFETMELRMDDWMSLALLIFLPASQLILIFLYTNLTVWNLRGELVASIEDYLVWDQPREMGDIHTDSNENIIAAYCEEIEEGAPPSASVGAIHFSNITNGKCIGSISPLDPSVQIAPRKHGDPHRSTISSTVREALENVSVVYFNQDTNEVYTGNQRGQVHVWSN